MVVGRGNLDAASRGIPLDGRVVVLGWPSIFEVHGVPVAGIQGDQGRNGDAQRLSRAASEAIGAGDVKGNGLKLDALHDQAQRRRGTPGPLTRDRLKLKKVDCLHLHVLRDL